ncbi:MAG: aminotransferase class I/II-fold pyridoxal phosphate-dependent enzyme [Lachnospiraceae bacterium]|nr:aminotransferase class I/II-fold pyridoxal phosphate-dependent enzyme [Lachnospiraceae bacterium]MBR0434979.1 aminotransferase class I/II-fold pyridoxal phosphate-dependent enzyme [Lachnospiraceae bacterium]
MVKFDCDYMQGAVPEILTRIASINDEQIDGYGFDGYCDSAKSKIREACGLPDAEVEFMIGGTQTNMVAITATLRSFEGVIAAETGHIYVHECGAIENMGHKVISLPSHNGKLDPNEVKEYMHKFYADETYPHMVMPKMVYISHPTELGSLYTLDELKALRSICDEYKMLLYVDGARLGYGLNASNTDVTLKNLAENVDMFYIGGTKVGALFGEALVIKDKNLIPNFFSIKKQSGAVLAKGWLLGLQFDTLFTDNLYNNISRHAIVMAEKLRQGFIDKGYRMYSDSYTNQQFFILKKDKIEELKKKVSFAAWEEYDSDHRIVRFATSWATREEDVEELLKLI